MGWMIEQHQIVIQTMINYAQSHFQDNVNTTRRVKKERQLIIKIRSNLEKRCFCGAIGESRRVNQFKSKMKESC